MDDHRADEILQAWFDYDNDIPTGMYVYSIPCLLILIISPAAILNLLINSFCPLDTTLVLASDNFYLVFPSSLFLPHLLLLQPPGGPFKNSLVMPSLLYVHIYLLSSDWEKHLWSSKYFEYVSVCLCVPFLWRSLQFLASFSPFLSLILCFICRESRKKKQKLSASRVAFIGWQIHCCLLPFPYQMCLSIH